MATSTPELTIVQLNLYRFINDRFEYLVFKRVAEDSEDQIWQPISETLRDGEEVEDALPRIAASHAGIDKLEHMSNSTYSYDWYSHGESGRDMVFAAQLPNNTPILPDLDRYITFEWLPRNAAIARIKWSGSKEAIRQLQEHLEQAKDMHAESHETDVPSDSEPIFL